MLAGQVVRVVTTGGGGWGDPLEREPELVQRDVIEGKVSAEAARDDYGVVLMRRRCTLDAAATAKLRETMRAKRDRTPAMIDRGPGYDADAQRPGKAAHEEPEFRQWRSKSRRSS